MYARTTISSYLDELRKDDRKKTNLLNKDAGDLRQDGNASNSVINTWQISFDHIREERRMKDLEEAIQRHVKRYNPNLVAFLTSVTSISRKSLGDQRPDVLTYMDKLRSILHNQGRLEEATQLREDVERLRIKGLGHDHLQA